MQTPKYFTRDKNLAFSNRIKLNVWLKTLKKRSFNYYVIKNNAISPLFLK